MKGFDRDYPWLSLCGLNCRLCTLYMDQYCPGCGGTRAVLALLAGHPVLSFLYHPLVPYCALVALVFAVSYAIYWKTKDPRFRLYLSDTYVHVGLGIIVVNFLVKNYLLAAKGIDILEQLPGW